MTQSSNRISNFWQELKRRKVVRVITVYAAAAFVILELVDIITEPLKLPEWLMPVVIVLLCVGFIIAIILSWIYDVKPEGGIVKTKPVHHEKGEDKPVSSKGWKIASYISFVVIVALIVLNIIPRSDRSYIKEVLEKSIAVLPFTSLSDDPEKQYLADGVMDAILLHLSKIEELRVMSRTSVEQYRDTDKTVTEICEELDVAFLLEGNFRKYGDQARLIVQLIQPGKEDHAWANQYDREWKDIFTVESEVAQSIAHELRAVITPKEKQLIEKTPTSSLTAYDFYQRGRDEYNKKNIERAEDLYHKALEYDSAFALAYVGLAGVYKNKHRWNILAENYLDSMLVLADIAISFDDQLAEAYLIKGDYYKINNNKEQAAIEYEKAIKLNPNNWEAYWHKGALNYQADFIETIDNLQKAASLYRGPEMSGIYHNLGFAYDIAGFREKAIYYKTEAFKLDNDSARFYKSLAEIEETHGNFKKAIELSKKSLANDSTDEWVFHRLGVVHSFLGLNEEYLEYFKKLSRSKPNAVFRIGHAYWVNGYKEEAEQYFNEGVRFHNELVKLDRHYLADFITFYNLAGAHSFLGNKEQAYKNLRLVNPKPRMPLWMIKDLKNDPLFNNIRDEPEFQQIIRDAETKYYLDHEVVRQWLEEQEML